MYSACFKGLRIYQVYFKITKYNYMLTILRHRVYVMEYRKCALLHMKIVRNTFYIKYQKHGSETKA
jgi:hypothetical protein